MMGGLHEPDRASWAVAGELSFDVTIAIGHIAEGNFNFTSIEATQVTDDDPEVERDETDFSFDLNQCDDDFHMYDDPRDAAQTDGTRGATQSDGPIDGTQSDVTRAGDPSGSNIKPAKEPRKKKRDDPMMEVMANYVEMKGSKHRRSLLCSQGQKMPNSSPSQSALLFCTRWKASHMEKETLHTRCSKMLRIMRFSSMTPMKIK
ncbi:Cullin-associated NEDD8-dissociated protein 1 [Hordeum vulgare]|nr:Cullin-associated NEDD8-dissociated protein 1 [Hordeum vulgare]